MNGDICKQHTKHFLDLCLYKVTVAHDMSDLEARVSAISVIHKSWDCHDNPKRNVVRC